MLLGFTEIEIAPVLCGVYVLYDEDEPVYVGQSADIHTRIFSHRQTGKRFTRVAFLALPASDLNAYEGALIRALRPRLSKSGPRDSSRDEEILTALGLGDRLPKPIDLPASTGFGDAIHRIRTSAGMSMHEFAARVGTSSSSVCEWENGTHGAPLKRIQRIAAEFGIDISSLMNLETDRPRPYLALGATIKAARRKAGLRQADLASRLNITDTAVSHWEAGWSRPSRDLMPDLAAAIGDVEVTS